MMSFFIVLVAGMGLKLNTLDAKKIIAMINHESNYILKPMNNQVTIQTGVHNPPPLYE